jgi:hypothetical protein
LVDGEVAAEQRADAFAGNQAESSKVALENQVPVASAPFVVILM